MEVLMARAVVVKRMDLSAGGLRAAAVSEKDGSAARRMLAIALILDGADRATAARSCGMDRQTLRDWVHRYNEEGLAGLHDRKSPGPKPKLTTPQLAVLAALIEAGPDATAHQVVRWRRCDLRDELQRRFGVEMHERTVGKQLRKLGYRRLSVRPQNPASDEHAQEAFKKTSLRRFKPHSPRRPRASRSKSGSRMKPALVNRGP
jgi:transposase